MAIDVLNNGAVILGDKVTCDGFHEGYPSRIQTHIHSDHLHNFTTSKGYQNIYLSEPSYDLLVNEFNADLSYRSNLHVIELGSIIKQDGYEIELFDNGHMLGSVQVCVRYNCGLTCGYSSDFSWPLNNIIEVDKLVIDSTYGSPDSNKNYTQDTVRSKFLELIIERIKFGPILMTAHRGTLQRTLCYLDGELKSPIIVSNKLYKELNIYKKYGYNIDNFYIDGSQEANDAMSHSNYIRIKDTTEPKLSDKLCNTTITLSAFMAQKDDPILQYTESSYSVAFSDHADFNGTLEYIQATRAKKVITDNTRGGNAVSLAIEIKNRLGIEAAPSKNSRTREWGM